MLQDFDEPPRGPFSEVFRWHLEIHGTRPDKSPAHGNPWRVTEFAKIIGELNNRGFTEKAVNNIIKGAIPSLSTIDHIRTAFFGRNIIYRKWILNFNKAYSYNKTPRRYGDDTQSSMGDSSELKKNDTRVVQEIFKSMLNQFDNSKLSSESIQVISMGASKQRLSDVGIFKPSMLAAFNYTSQIKRDAFLGDVKSLKLLIAPRVFRTKIRVQCLDIFPSAIATIIYMKENGFDVEVSYKYSIGRDLAYMLDVEHAESYEVIITGESGTYLSVGKEIRAFEHILCISNVDQFAYERVGSKSKHKRVLYTPRTSAEEHVRYSKIADVKEEEFDRRHIDNLDDGECIIRWSPFLRGPHLQVVSGIYHPFYFSLFGRKAFSVSHMDDMIIFLNGFVASWNFLKNNTQIAMRIIRQEKALHAKFAAGAEINVDV